VSRFNIDGDQYAIGAFDRQWNTAFYFPRLSLIENMGVPKDTVMPADIIKPGEYLNLNDNYYRFHDITNNGSYIILIKDSDISKITGTQVGMKAPDFRFTTINSDDVSLQDFHGEYLVISNTTMCYSEEDLFLAYKNFTDKYHDKVNFICLNRTDSLFKEIARDYDLKGNLVVISDNTADEGLDSYRPDFSSRECFLINTEGIIIDKFNLFDWESHMNKIEELNN
jgi:peroxiredoxin